MQLLFSLLRIKGLYMFRTLLAHLQEALHKRHLVYCVRVMSVGCTRVGVELLSTPILVHYLLIFRRRYTNDTAPGSEIPTHHVTRHNTPIHNILSTVPQLSISQKALGTLPEDGNVVPKHVGATIHN
jgi:hypothetical protein